MRDIIQAAAPPPVWAAAHFGAVALRDRRRVARVVRIAEAIAAHPGASIPQWSQTSYEVKATYQVFGHPEVIPDTLQAPHRAQVLAALCEPGTYLLLEDTSEFIWAGAPRPGLGPVGGSDVSGHQGFHLHSVLAVRWRGVGDARDTVVTGRRPAVPLVGLADQQYYVRQPRAARERTGPRRLRWQRPRESALWATATARLGAAPADPTVRWVRIADRGADIYEHLTACQAAGHGFVVRAVQNRGLVDPVTGASVGQLRATLEAAAPLGTFPLTLRTRPQQPARTATLAVSAVAVALRSPQRAGHTVGRLAPVRCWAVRVWEPTPPTDVTSPLEWWLLTDQPVTTCAQARHCAQQYATRWLLEEYHKGLKTGLGAERLQLETSHRLFAAIALLSLVALRVLALREQVHLEPDAPATASGLTPLELVVVSRVTQRPLTTVRDVALAVGRLGGHLNRRGDGLPGWQTLWHGMRRLLTLVEGVQLATELPGKFG